MHKFLSLSHPAVLTLFTLVVISFTGGPAEAGGACDHVTLDWIRAQLPDSGKSKHPLDDARIVSKGPKGDLCEVVLGLEGGLTPLYAGPTSVVAGRMFSQGRPVSQETLAGLSDAAAEEKKRMQEKRKAAAEARRRFFEKNHASLASLVAMTYEPAKSDAYIYVVTDPRCPHSKAMMPELEAVASEGKLGLRVILNPALGSRSRDMVAHALCNEYGYGDYRDMEAPKEAKACDRATGLIQNTRDLMKQAGLSAVPAVIAADGSWLVNGNDIGRVRKHLGLGPVKSK